MEPTDIDYFLYPIIRLLYWKSGKIRQKFLGYIFSTERLFTHILVIEELKNSKKEDRRNFIINVSSCVVGGLIVALITSMAKFFLLLF